MQFVAFGFLAHIHCHLTMPEWCVILKCLCVSHQIHIYCCCRRLCSPNSFMCKRVIPSKYIQICYTRNIHNHLIQSCSRTRIFTAILKVIYFNANACSFVGHSIHFHTHTHKCQLYFVCVAYYTPYASMHSHTHIHKQTKHMLALGISYSFYQMKTVAQ